MKTISLKLLGISLVLIFIAGCSSMSTSGSGSSTNSGAMSSGAGMNNVSGEDMSADVGNVVYFEFDQATLTSAARAMLMVHADRLKSSGANATLEGHADERGTREYNLALGERRAKTVRDFLLLQGVNSTQLYLISYGEERPVNSTSNDAAWQANRRVEIH